MQFRVVVGHMAPFFVDATSDGEAAERLRDLIKKRLDLSRLADETPVVVSAPSGVWSSNIGKFRAHRE